MYIFVMTTSTAQATAPTVKHLRQLADYFRARSGPLYATPEVSEAEALADRNMMHQVGLLAIQARSHGWLPDAPWLVEMVDYHSQTSENGHVAPGRAVYDRCPVNLFVDLVNCIHTMLYPQFPLSNIDAGSPVYFLSQAAACEILAMWIETKPTLPSLQQ